MNQINFYSPLKHNVSGSMCGREIDVPCKGKVCSRSGRGREEKGVVKPSNPSLTFQQIRGLRDRLCAGNYSQISITCSE